MSIAFQIIEVELNALVLHHFLHIFILQDENYLNKSLNCPLKYEQKLSNYLSKDVIFPGFSYRNFSRIDDLVLNYLLSNEKVIGNPVKVIDLFSRSRLPWIIWFQMPAFNRSLKNEECCPDPCQHCNSKYKYGNPEKPFFTWLCKLITNCHIDVKIHFFVESIYNQKWIQE